MHVGTCLSLNKHVCYFRCIRVSALVLSSTECVYWHYVCWLCLCVTEQSWLLKWTDKSEIILIESVTSKNKAGLKCVCYRRFPWAGFSLLHEKKLSSWSTRETFPKSSFSKRMAEPVWYGCTCSHSCIKHLHRNLSVCKDIHMVVHLYTMEVMQILDAVCLYTLVIPSVGVYMHVHLFGLLLIQEL